MTGIEQEILSRRTFAIISHPDAGKTTLTEKLLLYGGAIAQAGAVKGKKNSRAAVSDWMEIEKQRGISVSSSALQFRYGGHCINILDTPGHQDFSEDTYRTLMAADSAVMVIDAAKGVEEQTRKLFKVCAMRRIPVFTFMNKLDREARDPFELLDEIEKELGTATCAMNWPVGSGKEFRGVYERSSGNILLFSGTGGRSVAEQRVLGPDDPELVSLIGEDALSRLRDETELLDGAGADFDLESVRAGRLSPVFFGSALTNFGVEPFLKSFLELTTPPLPRVSDAGEIAISDDFSAFVFKIQANMNKAHRDRVAFMRICSGRFSRDMEVFHVQSGATRRLSQPQQLMAADREIVEEACAGDIIGIFDPGVYSIGDTLCTPGRSFRFEGVPTFAPEHFSRVSPKDTMKRKQFVKGAEQIAQEGAIQIFRRPNSGYEEVIVGVVGVLQFDVFVYRMMNEYGVELRMESLPYQYLRFIVQSEKQLSELILPSDAARLEDHHGRPLLVFSSSWSINFTLDRNPGLVLSETRLD